MAISQRSHEASTLIRAPLFYLGCVRAAASWLKSRSQLWYNLLTISISGTAILSLQLGMQTLKENVSVCLHNTTDANEMQTCVMHAVAAQLERQGLEPKLVLWAHNRCLRTQLHMNHKYSCDDAPSAHSERYEYILAGTRHAVLQGAKHVQPC